MPTKTREVRPGRRQGTVRTQDGETLEVPEGWSVLRPGDAALTRKLKASGPTWTIKEKKGRRMMSRGVLAPTERIEAARRATDRMRSAPGYEKKLAAGRARRDREQAAYVLEFTRHVLDFLGFHQRYAALAQVMAERVATHATPVGSGTVARTKRIAVDQRAEAAVIAWMRHQTTAYDHMQIARVKGERREVRRRLAQRSRSLLERYRSGGEAPADCPLRRALDAPTEAAEPRPSPAKRAKPRKVRPAAAPPRAPRPAPPRQALRPKPQAKAPATDDGDDEAARRAARQRAVRERMKRR